MASKESAPSPLTVFTPSRSGRKPTRVTWTYADGTTICPSDDPETAKLFRKMLAGLSRADLLLLEALIAQQQKGAPAVVSPELSRAASAASSAETL